MSALGDLVARARGQTAPEPEAKPSVRFTLPLPGGACPACGSLGVWRRPDDYDWHCMRCDVPDYPSINQMVADGWQAGHCEP